MDSSSTTEILSFAAPYFLSLIAFLIFMEQIFYLKKKSILPGPSLVLPFIGNAISLVRNPTQFWDIQSSFAKSSPLGVSANYILGKFIVFIRSTELSHQIFANKLFGEHNMIYMMGQDHKDLRHRIASNFTPKALSTYIAIQQRVILKHLISWERLASSESKPIALRFLVRNMNLETSQTVFAGPYLSGEERERFNIDYYLFNAGLLRLPIDMPGFSFRRAKLAVGRLIGTLTDCAAKSKARIASGEEPSCLIDFWMQDTVREEKEAADQGNPPPSHSSDREIGGHVFDFLFAAQDASTSSLLWAVTLLDSHPEVLATIREEVSRTWSPESDSPITAEHLQQLKYSQAVAREILRYRAPATLVPHIASQDFPLTASYTIPKGTIVFPSVFESSFQGFTEPERFDPDRFLEARHEDQICRRNFLVFGAGAHQCVGQRYAINHLVLFIAMFASLLDFKRHRTDGCDELAYVPTICPKDDCMVFLGRRCARYPNLSLN
ncbi:hypothetical protein Nepgr_029536 [Nepenthes gracilis]|uniref:sterol 22-desaturase n=1 Tax=Nepenthes gracilis TaxID=150966 RepID=A0AAD3TCM3_NEPGR|nr:hypothetical protein Nepgr_029536 [Nepenthes gracilis]